jgi:hypothetical protein
VVRALDNDHAQVYEIRETGAKIVALLRQGSHFNPACWIAGVPPRTARQWRELGRLEVGERSANGSVANADHVWFEQEIQRALGELEHEVVGHWLSATAENWQAARDFLARRFPQQWGNTEQRQIEVRGAQQMELQLVWGDEDEGRIEYDPLGRFAQGAEPILLEEPDDS